MSPSGEYDLINGSQQEVSTPPRLRFIKTLQINASSHIDPSVLGLSPSSADKKSIISSTKSEGSGNSSISMKVLTRSKTKKYSINHLSYQDTKQLFDIYNSILPVVEHRQRCALANSEKLKQMKKPDLLKQLLMSVNGNLPKTPPKTFYGTVIRKHVYADEKNTASSREWRVLYAVLEGNSLSFYRDQNYALHGWTFRKETPLKLEEGTLILETSSKKRPHLIRIILPNGGEYLIQLKTISEWARWLAELSTAVRIDTARSRLSTPYGTLTSTPRKSTASPVSNFADFPMSPILQTATNGIKKRKHHKRSTSLDDQALLSIMENGNSPTEIEQQADQSDEYL